MLIAALSQMRLSSLCCIRFVGHKSASLFYLVICHPSVLPTLQLYDALLSLFKYSQTNLQHVATGSLQHGFVITTLAIIQTIQL
jgi:hypothetical protein